MINFKLNSISKYLAFAFLSTATSASLFAADSTKTSAIFQKPVVTKHSVTIEGKKIDYEATAGHLTLTKEDGTERARIFFIAYTKSGVTDVSTRPLTISFNGGPGSSSVWLHLGVLGPRRVAMNADGTTLPPPYKLVDNDQSWLDLTDLVFIDPVSTGFSRAAEEKNAKEFHGYNQDIESVGEFIRRWISDNKRWSSPKYLIGESYGTTRASGLSNHLQMKYGMYLNGVILVSAVLNFQTIDFEDGNDLPFSMFLPTYAATAWYHKKLPADMLGKPLTTVVAEARKYAETEYAVALMKGNTLTEAEQKTVIQNLQRLTGLSADYIQKSNLRPVIFKFCQELLRSEATVIGRFDSRYKGAEQNLLSEHMENDPSHHPTIAGCFSTCINDYLSRELNVTTTLPYEVLTGRVWPWDFSNVQNQYLNVSTSLSNAMVTNPDLRVWVLNGYYDLATPFYATEYTFSHMNTPPQHASNVSMTYYQAGHMMYLLRTELDQMKKDAKAWFK